MMVVELKELWQECPVKMFVSGTISAFTSVFITLFVTSYIRSGVVVSIDQPVDYQIKVNGLNVDVYEKAKRTASPCSSYRELRKMVRYYDDQHTHVSDYVFINEMQPLIPKIGEDGHTIHLTLTRPLWGQGWYYTTEIQDNCGGIIPLPVLAYIK